MDNYSEDRQVGMGVTALVGELEVLADAWAEEATEDFSVASGGATATMTTEGALDSSEGEALADF